MLSLHDTIMLVIVAFMLPQLAYSALGPQEPMMQDSRRQLQSSTDDVPLWAWVIGGCMILGMLVSIINYCRRGCPKGSSQNNENDEDVYDDNHDNDDGGGFFASVFGGDNDGGFFSSGDGGDCGGGGGDCGGGGGD